MCSRRINAVHEIVFEGSRPFGYFGWPTVAKLPDGTLAAAASGFRSSHICPFGRTVLWTSADEGRSWSGPVIVNDSPVDDRDAGLCALPDGSLLVTHFGSDTRIYYPAGAAMPDCADFRPVLDSWEDDIVSRHIGSFLRRRMPDGRFGKRIPVAASSPHGPSLLPDGSLIYIGTRFGVSKPDGTLEFKMDRFGGSGVVVLRSADDGDNWDELAEIPNPLPGTRFCEPHALGLPDGRILCQLRLEGEEYFSVWQSESADGGRTWSPAARIAAGSPPHLLLHSSGMLVSSYGCRRDGCGQRVMLSSDGGRSWETDYILRDDGPTGDLGYPSTVELSDGSLFTVYYQQPVPGAQCALLASRWRLPGA